MHVGGFNNDYEILELTRKSFFVTFFVTRGLAYCDRFVNCITRGLAYYDRFVNCTLVCCNYFVYLSVGLL